MFSFQINKTNSGKNYVFFSDQQNKFGKNGIYRKQLKNNDIYCVGNYVQLGEKINPAMAWTKLSSPLGSVQV